MKDSPSPSERGGAQPKKVTMEDIAKSLGISKNSVSIALGNKSGVSDALRKRILERAAEMNYAGVAVAPERRNRYIVAIVPEYLHNDAFFYSEIFWAIETEAKQRGCVSIHIGVTKEMENASTPPELPGDIDIVGLLAIGVMAEPFMRNLCALGLPLATVDIAYNHLHIGCVGTANLSGGYMATQYLISQGHRRIGFIGPIHTALSIYERWGGFQLAMRHADLAVSPAYNILGSGTAFQLFDTVEVLALYLQKIDHMPTAWFCAGDRIAIALVNLLSQRGVRVPDDVSVMGFDDLAVAQMLLPRLSTVRVDRKQMGRLAVEQLLRLAEDEARVPTNTSLLGTLVVRESVKAI